MPRPYQLVGIRWLRATKAGALLDEMGLGKTMQVLLAMGDRGVVFCPASVKGTWAREARMWRPDLTATILDGKGALRWPNAGELVIVNYDVVSEIDVAEIGPAPEGTDLAIDEGHVVKNARTNRAKAVRAVARAVEHAAGRRWIVTATPICNRPMELKAVLDAVGAFGTAFSSYSAFSRAFGGAVRSPRAEPTLPSLLRRLVIMGGSFDYRGNTTPVAEWNISVDPEAAAEVFTAWGRAADAKQIAVQDVPIVCGLNLTENIALTPAILHRLGIAAGSSTVAMSVLDARGTRSVADNPLIRALEDAMRFYFEFHFDQGEGFLAHLHDPLAAAVALDPALIGTRPTTVDVELTGTLTRGMTIADWSRRWGRAPNAQVGVQVDPPAFFERFISRVGPFARGLAHS